jgi:hypothetical protein
MEEKISLLEKNLEAVTKLLMEIASKKEEPKVEVKQEQPKDSYSQKIEEEKLMQEMEKKAELKIKIENKVKNFDKVYSHLPAETIARVQSLNDDVFYKQAVLLDESFKNNELKAVVTPSMKMKMDKFVALSFEEKKNQIGEYVELLDESIEIQNKLLETKHSLVSKNDSSAKNKIGIDLMNLAQEKYNVNKNNEAK